MRAVVATTSGGPEVLEVRSEPDPALSTMQLLVDVAAVGVNYRDVYEREGNYGRQPPLIVGVEGAGTVAEVGEGTAEFSVGDRVAWVNAPGSYAERVVVDASVAVPIPDGVSFELGAAALLQGMTAHYLASSTYPVQPGDTVVVHAAAGGVGLLLTQIVKMRGGRVIATTSTDEKAALARAAGADVVTGYDGFAERVRELTGGEGAAAVYDGVGKATLLAGLEALKPRGMMVLYGAASGQPDPLDLSRLGSRGSLFVTRPILGAYTATRPELLQRAGDVFAWIESGELSVRIGARYPLAQARQAHEDLQARRTTGKLLLIP